MVNLLEMHRASVTLVQAHQQHRCHILSRGRKMRQALGERGGCHPQIAQTKGRKQRKTLSGETPPAWVSSFRTTPRRMLPFHVNSPTKQRSLLTMRKATAHYAQRLLLRGHQESLQPGLAPQPPPQQTASSCLQDRKLTGPKHLKQTPLGALTKEEAKGSDPVDSLWASEEKAQNTKKQNQTRFTLNLEHVI